MSTVALIDYGSGNLKSAEKALARAASDNGTGHHIVVTSDPRRVAAAERIVLPGVGAFADCMRGVSSIPGMIDTLKESVLKRGTPFLGICVGMQLLADVGREHGDHEGLGWISGEVVRITPTPDPLAQGESELKVPHMGWNALSIRQPHPLMKGMADGTDVYFVHSYCMRPKDPAHVLASTDYGGEIAALIGRDNIAGTQFHPEKSQAVGLAFSLAFSNGARERFFVILYPAIDLKDGCCVRLRQGNMAQATIFNEDPAAQARAFEAAGFAWLHVVDLNGAFAGKSANTSAINTILKATENPLQLGGGIRDRAAIDAWLEAGVARVILGTAAVRNPDLVKEAARAHPKRIAVGIDAKDGKVAVEGWAQASTLSAIELAKRFEDAGVAAIIFTDIARDGMLGGVNVAATAELALAVGIPVIASGGVTSVRDIDNLSTSKAPIAGVVIGRALYDGRIDAETALAAARR